MSDCPSSSNDETRIGQLHRASDLADACGNLSKASRLRREALAIQKRLRIKLAKDIADAARAEGLTVQAWKQKHDPDPRMSGVVK